MGAQSEVNKLILKMPLTKFILLILQFKYPRLTFVNETKEIANLEN